MDGEHCVYRVRHGKRSYDEYSLDKFRSRALNGWLEGKEVEVRGSTRRDALATVERLNFGRGFSLPTTRRDS